MPRARPPNRNLGPGRSLHQPPLHHRREQLAQQGHVLPVRHGASPIEQARLSEHEGTGTDRAAAGDMPGGGLQPANQAFVAHGGFGAVAAGHDERGVLQAGRSGQGFGLHEQAA